MLQSHPEHEDEDGIPDELLLVCVALLADDDNHLGHGDANCDCDREQLLYYLGRVYCELPVLGFGTRVDLWFACIVGLIHTVRVVATRHLRPPLPRVTITL